MIKNTILITAEKKEKTIINTIQSCLNQNYKNYEIIVIYSSLKNENEIKRRTKSKKVFFLKINKKIRNNIHDQLFKIKEGLKKSKGKSIFLLDGDDTFLNNKLNFLSKIHNKKKIMILDGHFISNKEGIFRNKSSKLSNFFLYKKLLNDWPKKVCTSSISADRKLMVEFFQDIKFYKYKYLAVDILLSIYCNQKDRYLEVDKYLTTKNQTDDSVDKNFIGFGNKFYWLRRLEQHRYNFLIKKKEYLNIDFLITYFLCLLIKFN